MKSWVRSFLLLIALTPLAASSAPRSLPRCADAWETLIPGRGYQYDISRREKYSDYAARVNRKRCLKPWTVLVYMAAENDLTPYAYWDLYEMEAGFESGRPFAGSTLKSDLVVQLDSRGDTGLRRIHVFQTPEVYDTRLNKADFLARTERDIRSPVVKLLRETASSEASRLQAFLEWGMREYPSEHYMVVVWGHGQGWTSIPPKKRARSRVMSRDEIAEGLPPTATSAPERAFEERGFGGLAFNDSQGTHLDIPSLKNVLARVSRDVLDGRPIDVYASDACLMQMLEVATEMSEATRFIVGSTQVQNFLGLPYRRLMYEINTGRFGGERARMESRDEPYLVARMIPEVFQASMRAGGLQGRFAPEGIQTITMSSISSRELERELVPAFERFSSAMLQYLREDPMRAVDVQFVIQNAPSFQGGAQEAGAFLSLMKEMIEKEAERADRATPGAIRLRGSVDQAKAALHRSVISYALGKKYSGYEGKLHLLGFKAASVWLPVSPEDYRSRVADFRRSEFYRRVPGWDAWLKLVYQP